MNTDGFPGNICPVIRVSSVVHPIRFVPSWRPCRLLGVEGDTPASARQLRKLMRQQQINGESLSMASEVLLQKWASRGQDPAVLDAIWHDVFNIVPPAP
jgi:hypothetical protein